MFISFSAIAKKEDRNVPPKPGTAPVVDYGESTGFTLPNGLRVIVISNHNLPSITCDLQFAIKPALEQEYAGYRGMMGELLQDGTRTRTKAQLIDIEEQTSTEITTTDEEISARGLARNREQVLELMSDIVMNTVIHPEDVEEIKRKTIDQLTAHKNDADVMLNNVAAALNYGRSHPYGEVITDQTVERIRPENCIRYYNTYFKPNVAYLAIVGDVSAEDIKTLVEKYFGKWQHADVPVTEYGHYDAPLAPHVSFIPRKTAIQSIIRITYPVELSVGSEYSIRTRVANMLLGGSTNSLFFRDLRETHKWAYTTYSSILENDLQGSFNAYTRCRIGVDDSALTVMLADMRRIQSDVDNTMLEKAKWAVTGNYAMSVTDPATVATYAINIERYHLPKDYYRNYLKEVNNISANDVRLAANKYINPDDVNIIIAGNLKDAAKFDKYSHNSIDFFDNYAEIIRYPYDTSKPLPVPAVSTDTRYSSASLNSLDNSNLPNTPTPALIPAEPAAAPRVPATTESISPAAAGAESADIIRKYILAIGGEHVIANIKSIKKVSVGSISSGPSSLELTVTEIRKSPSQMMLKVEGMGTVIQKQVLNGKKGYTEMQGQKKPLNADDIVTMTAEADIQRILHPEQYGIDRSLKGMSKVNGNDAFVINAIDKQGKLVVEYYDMNTGYLVKKEEADLGAGGLTKTTEYSDYKEVPGGDGYKIPYRSKETEDKHSATSRIKTVEINKAIPDSVFN